ncbi:MAG: hypothetical protein EHM61_02585 [Acidobacteria bacterium]|nr:MAG: hypothetical protein EHM61_02585 [Acidobacteriota bacterium]
MTYRRSIEPAKELAKGEGLENIHDAVRDINQPRLPRDTYDAVPVRHRASASAQREIKSDFAYLVARPRRVGTGNL